MNRPVIFKKTLIMVSWYQTPVRRELAVNGLCAHWVPVPTTSKPYWRSTGVWGSQCLFRPVRHGNKCPPWVFPRDSGTWLLEEVYEAKCQENKPEPRLSPHAQASLFEHSVPASSHFCLTNQRIAHLFMIESRPRSLIKGVGVGY